MQSRIIRSLFAVLLVAAPAAAQVQPTAWPEYTDAQRWERAAWMSTLAMAAAMAHGKAQGQTMEEFGRWWSDVFTPSWGQPGSYGPLQVMRGMRRNFLIDPGAKVEILSETDSAVSARVARSWARYFGETGELYGIRLAEYDDLYAAFARSVAEYHGLNSTVRRDGDDLILTFARR